MCAFEEPVAPPMPSRPVRPPSSTITSPGAGRLATHVVGRRRAHHRADLHALGGVAGMVQLVHLAGCQADLVAVGRVARRRRGHQLALRQLARQRLAHGHERVGRAGHAHGLVDVAAPGKRVADSAAHAGGRAAERLDLGGMVVRLVLEQVAASPAPRRPRPPCTFTVQALISSDSSSPVRMPFAFSQRAPMVPMSMRHTGFSSRPSSWRMLQVLLEGGAARPRRRSARRPARCRMWCGGSGRTSRCRSS